MNLNQCFAIFYQQLSLAKQLFRLIIANWTISFLVIVSLLANLLIFILFLVKIGFRQNIPLHYNVYFGINLMGDWYQLLVIPFLGLLVILINSTVATFIYLKERMLAYFLVGSTLAIQILLLLAGLAIVWLNT
jgi:hypothetical protein